MKTVRSGLGWHNSLDELFARVDGFTYVAKNEPDMVLDFDGTRKKITGIIVTRVDDDLVEILHLEGNTMIMDRRRTVKK